MSISRVIQRQTKGLSWQTGRQFLPVLPPNLIATSWAFSNQRYLHSSPVHTFPKKSSTTKTRKPKATAKRTSAKKIKKDEDEPDESLVEEDEIDLEEREDDAVTENSPESKPSVLEQIQLRDYQEECIKAVTSAIADGKKRLGVSLATGGGKTVVFTQLISRVAPLSDRATKTLIMAHRRELIDQAAKHSRRAYPDLTIELELGKIHATGKADITIASIQSIVSGDRLAKFDPLDYKLILVDEAHHITSPSYLKLLEHMGLRTTPKEDTETKTTPTLVGVSATFSRADGISLGTAIDEIVYHRDYLDMIADKWLSNVKFSRVNAEIDLENIGINAVTDDWKTGELAQRVNTVQNNEILVRSWLSLAQDRKSTLVFCVDKAHVQSVTQDFIQRGVNAQFITADTNVEKRRNIIEAFRNMQFPVLVNCGVFTEGTDIPNIDCVLLARPTRSSSLLIQMIGRGMRLFPGKQDCHVIDMASSLDAGVNTVATLMGLDPSEIPTKEELTLDELTALKRKKEEQRMKNKARNRLLAYNRLEVDVDDEPMMDPSVEDRSIDLEVISYDSIFDLVADSLPDQRIRDRSSLAWVCVGQDSYVLYGLSKSYIRINPVDPLEQNDDGATHVLEKVMAIPGAERGQPPYFPPKEIARGTFKNVVAAGDSFAQGKWPRNLLVHTAKWRRGPPTQQQIHYLNKLRDTPLPASYDHKAALEEYHKNSNSEINSWSLDETSIPDYQPITVHNCTKGMANDMITRYTHGAKGRFKDSQRRARKAEKIAIKLLAKKRNTVVGPVSQQANKDITVPKEMLQEIIVAEVKKEREKLNKKIAATIAEREKEKEKAGGEEISMDDKEVLAMVKKQQAEMNIERVKGGYIDTDDGEVFTRGKKQRAEKKTKTKSKKSRAEEQMA